MKRLFLIIVALCFAFIANAQTITCMVCRGSGALICPACGGAGMTYSVFGWVPCYICGGTRFIPCSICHGKGSVTYVAPPAQSLNGNPYGGSYGSPYGGTFDNRSSSSSSMVREKRSSMSQSQLLGWMVLRPIVQNVISLGAMGRCMHIIPAVIAMVRATIHTNLCHLA